MANLKKGGVLKRSLIFLVFVVFLVFVFLNFVKLFFFFLAGLTALYLLGMAMQMRIKREYA